MRSQLVFDAGFKIENRFLLATTAMQATKKLHISSTRMEDTVNKVLTEVANGTPMHGKLPEVTPPPAIDALLIAPVINEVTVQFSDNGRLDQRSLRAIR